MKKLNHRKTIRSIGVRTIQILIILSVVSSAFVGNVSAQTPSSVNYTEEWSVTLSGAGDAVIGPDGNVYTLANGTGVRALDSSDGSTLWTQSNYKPYYGVQQDDLPNGQKKAIAVNNHGVYAVYNPPDGDSYLVQYDRDNGSVTDFVIFSTGGNIELGNIHAADGYVVVRASTGVNVFSTTDTSITEETTRGGTNPNARAVIDQYNNTYESIGGSEREISKQPNTIWTTGAGYLEASDGADSLAVNVTGTNGENSTVYVAQNNGLITQLTSSGDTFSGNPWDTDITSGGTSATDIAVDNERNIVIAGENSGTEVSILNTSGSVLQTLDINSGNSNEVRGVDAQTVGSFHYAVGVSDGGVIRFYSEVGEAVQSIDMSIDDDQLLPSQSTSYTVTGTFPDSSTADVTSSSNVSADDTNVVSVNEGSATITYQGDGSTIVRANYTNATGEILWSNKTMETDTPVITLNVNKSTLEFDRVGSYTVTNETFGTSTNVSLSASVTSDNTTVVTVDEPSLEFNAQTSAGVANLTASDGSYSSSEVQISVIEPTAITYANWEFLSGGERALLIFSDWTILWLLGSVLVSVMFTKWHRAPKLGVITFAGLSVIGWVTGFVPGYVILSETIFVGFVFFFIYWSPSGESG